MGFLNDDCNGKNKKFRRNNVFFSNSCFPLGKTISSSSKFRSLVVSTSIFPKKSQPTKNNSLKKKTTLKKRVATSPPPQPVDEIGGTSYKLHTSLSFARVQIYSRVWMLQPPMMNFFAWEVGCSAGGRGSL